MGEHLVANNKLAYSAHQTPPITPDGTPSGAPSVREAVSDPQLRDLRVLRGFIFDPCNPCVPPTVGPVPNKFFSVVSVPPWFDDPPLKKLQLASWRRKWN